MVGDLQPLVFPERYRDEQVVLCPNSFEQIYSVRKYLGKASRSQRHGKGPVQSLDLEWTTHHTDPQRTAFAFWYAKIQPYLKGPLTQ